MFVNLHVHNEFSLFDGFGRAVDIVDRVKELGQEAIGISNHGNVSGFIEHYYACKDKKI